MCCIPGPRTPHALRIPGRCNLLGWSWRWHSAAAAAPCLSCLERGVGSNGTMQRCGLHCSWTWSTPMCCVQCAGRKRVSENECICVCGFDFIFMNLPWGEKKQQRCTPICHCNNDFQGRICNNDFQRRICNDGFQGRIRDLSDEKTDTSRGSIFGRQKRCVGSKWTHTLF